MRFEMTSEGFKKDGQAFFLLSGEMHYFRVKKKDWPKHLEKMKRAKLDSVTTYIGWSFHEYEEGKFDLTGQTVPERDIVGFIDLCGQMGLNLNVKPGPYILAEYQDQGIPRWLLARHPEIQVYGPNQKPNIPFVCSFMHPTYLQYAAKWFDQIIPVLKDRQISSGGPILMTQICNEVGLQHWLAGCGDYNPETIKYYYKFLAQKYNSIQALNTLYKTNYSSFEQVIPPAGNTQTPQDIARYRDWHEFHRWYYRVYIEYLINDLRKRGITTPFYENVPGWAFGKAAEFPTCATLYSDTVKACPELLLGLDHIPENVDFRNFHDAAIITEMTRSVQGRKMPIFSAEFQAGSREHCVRTYPNELELFYKAALAYGTQGWNYYMFSQGKNPPGEGVYGPTFYWDTPLDVKAKEGPLYDTICEINNWIRANESNFVPSKKTAKIGVSFYKPYYETEFFYPLFLKDKYFRTEKTGLTYDYKWLREAFYYEGLLKVLNMLNFSHEIPDLQIQSLEEFQRYELLWVFCLEMMDAQTQSKLVDFVKSGGKAIFYPILPRLDLEGRPCDILKKGLGIEGESLLFPVESKVSYFNREPVNGLPILCEFPDNGGTPIAKFGRKVCGFEKVVGRGRATVMGTIPNYQIAEHIGVFQEFMEKDGIKPEVGCSEPDIITHLRKGPQGSFLFVLNFHPVEKQFVLDLSIDGKPTRIPSSRKISIPGTYGVIMPIDQKIRGGKIVYSTSEFLGQTSDAQGIKLLLKGSRDIAGEMVLKLEKPPQKVLIQGKEISFSNIEIGTLVKYRHSTKEFTLEIL